MSSRRRAGFSEGKGTVPVDLCLKAFFAHRLFDHIHLAAKNTGQPPFELAQAAEIVEAGRRECPPRRTATSTSCAVFSPRATEPNNDTLSTPAVRISCACAFKAAMTWSRFM